MGSAPPGVGTYPEGQQAQAWVLLVPWVRGGTMEVRRQMDAEGTNAKQRTV